MPDMLSGGASEGRHRAHAKDLQPSWQVRPSGDHVPGAGAMAVSLAYREGVIFHTEVHRSGSWSLGLSGSGACCLHSDIAVCAVCTVLL